MIDSIKTSLSLIRRASKTNKKFIGILILNVVISSIEAYGFFKFIELITNFIANKDSLDKAIYVFIFLCLLKLINAYISTQSVKIGNEFIYQVEEELIDKSMSISYKVTESKDFYDLQQRANYSLRNQYALENMIEALVNIIQGISIIIVTSFIISSISFWTGFVVLILVFINFYIRLLYSKKDEEFYNKLAPINNWIWYYQYIPLEDDRFIDIKANAMETNIIKSSKIYIDKTIEIFTDFYNRMGIRDTLSDLTDILIYFFVLITGVVELYNGKFNIDYFAILIMAIFKITNAIKDISESLIDFWRYSLFSKPIIEFLSLPDPSESPLEIINTKEIHLTSKDLKFAYNHKNVLEDINFDVNENKLIVIIGENGCGKSTLVKLIAGMYTPNQGYISYNGYDTDRINYSHISPVFQDFKLIKDFTSLENIRTEVGKDYDNKMPWLLDLLNWQLNFDLGKRIGKELSEDYVELSGGQGQQVAILRAIYNKRNIIILDEPTASIDLEKERDIYKAVTKLRDNNIVFLVSHRLSSVHQADEIWFINDGKLEIFTSHKDAMKNSEIYRDLYTNYYDNYSKVN
ncbi:ABC transporter ATP-binding protein [Anaerococcus sp. Marseille-Q7828]|uniref:ATP-binding cassette domain-containing protein n=1 Tax=Anaerococcus sp. Marseille-Q7828 TaxID=3036300 RepID=UPI0024AD711F|nr:ABC transporter ATP-binding protein [Anaerococcus sp. Marseille-Q7828]